MSDSKGQIMAHKSQSKGQIMALKTLPRAK
nr:MAG TPA: hypothetical protein [Caudoviricetes sp.]